MNTRVPKHRFFDDVFCQNKTPKFKEKFAYRVKYFNKCKEIKPLSTDDSEALNMKEFG
jgi:hypothetical protein